MSRSEENLNKRMKQEEIYKHLKQVAAKLEIKFAEHNFRPTGIKVKSGLCKIEGRLHFYMDKHKKVRAKNEILAACLSGFPLDEIDMEPAIREFIDKS